MSNQLNNCCWIGAEETCSSPVIIRRFRLEQSSQATLTITGLGYFEAYLNSKPVTDMRFLPVVTDYEPRDLTTFLYPLNDRTKNRIYTYTFPITHLIIEGENTLEIRLGNGFYRQNERVCEGSNWKGSILKAVYTIEADTLNGPVRFCSDGRETWRESEIRYNNLFHGEIIDHSFKPGPEKPVLVLPAPKAELTPAIGTADKLIRTIHPVCLGECNGRKVFDAGENVTGVVRLTSSAPACSRIRLSFAEECNDDLTLNYISTGCYHTSASGKPQVQMDEFVTSGQTCVFMPRFVWHAFRYFDVCSRRRFFISSI